MNIITTAKGVEYRQQEFTDSWGRNRVCYKRLDTLPKEHAETCAECGAAISTLRSTKRFCSDACKMREYRRRKAA